MNEMLLESSQLDEEQFVALRDYLRASRLYHLDKNISSTKNYVLTCACIEKLMPSISSKEALGIFKTLNYYKGLTWIQQRAIIKSLLQVEQNGDLGFLKNIKKPRIYCSFHIGSYRLIPFQLLRHGIDLAIIFASETLKVQGNSFSSAFEELKKEYGLTNSLTFIDAESSAGVLHMMRAIKEGKSLLFYIDGNTGVGSNRNDGKMQSIDFMGTSIFSRKGVAHIAYMCEVPIIMTLCNYITDDQMRITYYTPISPKLNSNINDSSQNIVQSIYDNFTGFLHQYPAQWEGWMYIINALNTELFLRERKESYLLESDKTYIFDKEKYSFFLYKNTLYLLNKLNFRVYPIQQELQNILEAHKQLRTETTIIPLNIFEYLVQENILVITN